MALTDNIGNPSGGMIRPTETPGRSTNVFAGLNKVANTLGGVFEVQAEASARRQAASERAAEREYQRGRDAKSDQRAESEAARAEYRFQQEQGKNVAEDTAASIALADRERAFNNIDAPAETIFGGFNIQDTVPLSAAGEQAVGRIEVTRRAVRQGKVSQSTLDLITRREVDGFIAANPDKVSEFMEALKKAGVDDPLIRSIEADRQSKDRVQSLDRSVEDAYIKAATEVGTVVFNTDGSIDRAASMAAGAKVAQANERLRVAEQQLNFANTQSTIDERSRNAARSERDDIAVGTSIQVADEATNSVVISLGRLFTAAKTPEQISQAMQLVPRAKIQLQTARSAFVQRAGNIGPEALRQGLAYFDDQIKNIEEFSSGEGSELKSRLDQLEIFRAASGLSQQAAYPVWSKLEAIVGRQTLVEFVSGGNVAALFPEETRRKLTQEMAAGGVTPGGTEARNTLSQIALVISGAAKLEELNPTDQRRLLPTLQASARQQANALLQGGGNASSFVNSQAAVTNAVFTAATASTLTLDNLNQMRSGLTGGVGSDLRPKASLAILELAKRPGFEDDARALAQANVNAGQKLLLATGNLQAQVSKGGIYNVQYNERSGRYEVKVDEAKLNAARRSSRSMGGFVGGSGVMSSSPIPSGAEATQLANNLNELTAAMGSLRELDPTFGGARVTFEQARTFYATGKMPEGVKSDRQRAVSQTSQFEAARTDFEKSLNDSTNTNIQQRERAVSGRVRQAPPTIRGLLQTSAQKYGVDPALVEAVAFQESRFNPRARSPVGAFGVMQLMPGTARELGVDPNNVEQNIDGGVRYLAQQLERFNGNVDLALAAYNAGPNRVAKLGRVPRIQETQDYVRKITSDFRNRQGT